MLTSYPSSKSWQKQDGRYFWFRIGGRALSVDLDICNIIDEKDRFSALELRVKGNWEKGEEGWDLPNIVFCFMGIFALIIWEVFLKKKKELIAKMQQSYEDALPDIFFFAVVFLYVVINTVDFLWFFAKVVVLFIHFNVLRQFFNITKRFYCIFCKGKKKLTTFSLHILAKLIKRLFVLKGIL